MITKRELRKMISNKKKEHSVAAKIEKSKAVFDQIKQLKEFQEAKNVLCYWSMEDEVHTHGFVIEASANKNIFLPVVSGDDLLIRKFTGTDNMKEGISFSILEPDSSENVNISNIDLVIAPGVAFDLSGGRIGRGKGYYDRLLTDTNIYKIGVCFDFQLVECVPIDEHDILMNKIIFG